MIPDDILLTSFELMQEKHVSCYRRQKLIGIAFRCEITLDRKNLFMKKLDNANVSKFNRKDLNQEMLLTEPLKIFLGEMNLGLPSGIYVVSLDKFTYFRVE